MSAPMRSTDFKALVEPILNQFFDGDYETRKDEWKQVFDEIFPTIKRAYFEEPVAYAFGAAPEVAEGSPMTYQQGGILFTKRYTYKQFGMAFALTNIMYQDGDHINMGAVFSKHLAKAIVETQETRCANVFNRAFNPSYVGGDGVALNSLVHPTASGSFSNTLATPAAMSQTSVEQMLIQIRKAVNNNGKRIKLMPQKIVCSSDNMFQAEVILKSPLRTGTNNNDINGIKSAGGLDESPAILSRIVSPTAWWIKTNAPEGLKMLVRQKMEKGMEGDWETNSMRYKALIRCIEGWTDPRAAFGTAGL